MKNKWFKKKEKEYKSKYEGFIHLHTKTYDYTKGAMKVINAIKGEYRFDSRAYRRAIAYHKRTVIIPKAREIRTKYINDRRRMFGKNFNCGTPDAFYGMMVDTIVTEREKYEDDMVLDYLEERGD